MMPKIAGTDSDTNTVQVELDSITAFGKQLTYPRLMFNIGKFCEIS